MKLRVTHRGVHLGLQLVLLLEALVALWERQWGTALLTGAIIGVTFTPVLIERRFRIVIPSQLQLLAIAFVFASLFLGEVQRYYDRFWWWDMALHTTSGFLLGITGFVLVHVLNETDQIGVSMRPGFVAFFAFLFALGMGAFWEIFEFAMDSFFGMNMQKPMLNDPSGLTDTMWDLILDAIGALVISVLGYRYLRTNQRTSFLERWIDIFVARNPRLFKREERSEQES